MINIEDIKDIADVSELIEINDIKGKSEDTNIDINQRLETRKN